MKNNKKSDDRLEELLRAALTSEIEPEDEINRQILRNWKESFAMNKQKNKSLKIAVAATACVLLTGVSVGAAVRYLSAVEVAEELGNDQVIEAFQGDHAILLNDVQEWGNYRVTLLGITTGENIFQNDLLDDFSIDMDNTYAAVAIEHADGTPMPSTQDDTYGDVSFFVSPLIEGLSPWQYNIAGGICGGYSETVINGVQYRIIECDDIMMFADRTIYLCVSDTTFYETMAYNYDETTGAISRNESYDGMNLLFTLPIDPSEADPEAAAEYVKVMEEQWNSDDTDDTESSDDEDPVTQEARALCDQITELLKQGKKDEAVKDAAFLSEEMLTLKNSRYEFNYSATTEENGEATVVGGTYYFYPENFTDGLGFMITYDFDEQETVKSLTIMILQDNGDNTASIEVWEKALR